MTSFLIWGGGGHGKVVADLIRALGHQLSGYVDVDPEKLGREVEPGGGRVVMLQDEFERRVRDEGRMPDGVDAIALAIGDNRRRHECGLGLAHLPAPPLVHPSAVVSPSAVLGPGSVVFAGAVINADARLGAAVIVNSSAVVEHDCRVGDAAHLSPRAALAGGARVGERSWIGMGASVLQGVSIGRDVVVGAGAVVLRDLPDGCRVAGVPARPI